MAILPGPDGSEDYSSHDGWLEFTAAAELHNNFVIGRKTLDIVEQQYEGFGFDDIHCKYKVVVSRQPDLKLDSAYTQATSPEDVITKLQDEVDVVWLVGGSEINAAFAKAGLIDEVILTIEPHIIGKGISLFAPANFDLDLSFRKVEQISGDRLKITYAVKK